MSNSYFQFKQFRIEQDRCAMKVTTDACIQGAWVPILPGVKRVLDIGTGTGLLALMLAQRNPDVIIDAIEFDKDAAAQANENIAASPWSGKINVIEGDARIYRSHHRYDLIISNPPFFINSLLGDKDARNNARHALSLTYDDMLNIVSENLSDEGYSAIMLPAAEFLIWQALMKKHSWAEMNILSVRHRDNAEVKRVVGLFKRMSATAIEENSLVIRGDDNNYTAGFTKLLEPFYLDF